MERTSDFETQGCGSEPLNIVKVALEDARIWVDLLIYVMYDIIEIFMNLMQLMGITDASLQKKVTDELLHWFIQLLLDMKDALKALGTMVFKMIFESSPMGKRLQEIIKIICGAIVWVINEIWKKILCEIISVLLPPILDVVVGILRFIDGIVQAINFLFRLPDPNIILRAINDVEKFKKFIENDGLNCKNPMDNFCWPTSNDTVARGELPVADRCWVGYETQAGDNSPLGCQPSYTCIDNTKINDPTTTDNENTRVCDACPLLQADDFMHYGCSPLTKKCTCGVQQYEPTQCTSHEQCYLETSGASCQKKSDIFSIAFSTTPCGECMSQPICVITSMDSAGYCTCPFDDITVESCVNDIGDRVTPDPTKKCNIMTNGRILSTRNSYISWKDLAITECGLLDPAQTYCYRVDATGGVQVRKFITANGADTMV